MISLSLSIISLPGFRGKCHLDLPNFQREQIVGVCLPGASVTGTATLLDVSIAVVSKVMMAYTNHGKTSSAKRNND